MRKIAVWILIFAAILMLASCARTKHYYQFHVADETWMCGLHCDPTLWTRYADRWFLYGKPNATECYIARAPLNKAITISTVKPTNFNEIFISGSFQVQMLGGQDARSIFIVGPNALTQLVRVDVRDHILYIHQVKGAKVDLKNVIVRIGICNLKKLVICGATDVSGRSINSDGLELKVNNRGKVILAGQMNLKDVTITGPGETTLIGVCASALNVKVLGCGVLNMSGRIGLRSIVNMGVGRIYIMNATSDALSIEASGRGVTAIVGCINLTRLIARQASQVYISQVTSRCINAMVRDYARVGLAGSVQTLNVEVCGCARFQGQYLRAGNVYVKTHQSAHANVNGNEQVFAAAYNSSSIFVFGSPSSLSRNTMQSGFIVRVGRECGDYPKFHCKANSACCVNAVPIAMPN